MLGLKAFFWRCLLLCNAFLKSDYVRIESLLEPGIEDSYFILKSDYVRIERQEPKYPFLALIILKSDYVRIERIYPYSFNCAKADLEIRLC